MRRIARLSLLGLSMMLLSGCGSISAPWSRTTIDRPESPLQEPEVHTARDAVSDDVMIGDRTRGGYVDSPSGP